MPSGDGAEPLLVVVTTPDDLLASPHPGAAAVAPEEALQALFDAVPASPATRPAWTSRTRGHVPVGPRGLAALCCEARLTRLLTDAAGSPLDSNPTARQLSRRERRALESRAAHRCERLGCGRAAHLCVPHHVVPWALGGPSTQANTVLLCRSCHHLLHDRDRPLELTRDRRIGPRGWLRGGPPGSAPPGRAVARPPGAPPPHLF